MSSPTPTETPTMTPTVTPSVTPSNTVTPTNTISPTRTNIPTRTPTKTITKTPTNTPSNTTTPSFTPTNTITGTPDPTGTPTQTVTQTITNTNTPTKTNTPTITNTKTQTQTPTLTRTQTPTLTRTQTQTPTNTPTVTNTPTQTTTQTLTPTKSAIICGKGITQSNYVYYDCCGNVITGNTPGISVTFNYTKPYVGITPIYVAVSSNCPTTTPTPTRTKTPTPSVTKTNTPSITKTQTQTQSSSPISNNGLSNQTKFLINSCDTFITYPLGLECKTISYPVGPNGTGSIAVIITGGTPPYQVYWNNIQTNTQVLNNVGPGSYDVLVVDNYGDYSARTTCVLTAITPTPTSSPTPTATPGATPTATAPCQKAFQSSARGVTNATGFGRNGLPNIYPVEFNVTNVSDPIVSISLTINNKTAYDAKRVGMLLVNPTGSYKTLIYGGGPRGPLTNSINVNIESYRTSQWDGVSAGSYGVNNTVSGGDMIFPSPANVTYYDGTTGPDFSSMIGLSGNEVNGRWKLYIVMPGTQRDFSFESFTLNINNCTTPPPIPNICFQFECKTECGMSYSWTFTPRGTDSTGYERWAYDDPGGWSYDIYRSTSSNSWVCEMRGGINSCRNTTTQCPCCVALVFKSTTPRRIPTLGWAAVSVPQLDPDKLQYINTTLLVSSGLGLLCQGYSANISLSLNSKVDPSCGGTCDGTINVNVVGGVPPYTFSLDNGTSQSQPIFTNVCYGNGTHNVLVTDRLGNSATLPVTFNYSNPTSIYNVTVYDITNISNTSSGPNTSTDFSRWTVSVQPPIPAGVTLNVTLSVEIEQTIYEPGTGNISYVNEVYLDNVLQNYNSISQTTSVVPRQNCVGENVNIQTYIETYNLQLTSTSDLVGESTSTLVINNGNVDQNGCVTTLSQSILASVIDATLSSCDCCMVITSENSGGINLHTLDAPTVEEGDSFIMYARGLRYIKFDQIFSAPRAGSGAFSIEWGDGTPLDFYNAGYDLNIRHTYDSIMYPNGYNGQIILRSTSLSNIDTIMGATTLPLSSPSSGYYPLIITSSQLKKLTKLNNLILTNSNVFFSGVISDLPREMTNFTVERTNLSGGVNQLPSQVLKDFVINFVSSPTNSTNITGTTTGLPRTLTGLTIQTDNVISGTVSSLPPNIVKINIGGRNTLSGSISTLPVKLQDIYFGGLNTINQYTPGYNWSTTMNQVQIISTVANSAVTNDNILINLDSSVTTWIGNKYISLRGTSTVASNTAKNSLMSKGVSLNFIP